MKKIELFTDGACSGNPGRGGWGAILRYNGKERELSGASKDVTNNKMELQAVIEGLSALKEACYVEIYTDSKYVMDGSSTWIVNWKKNNWRTSTGHPVKNLDLWKMLDRLLQYHVVNWNWVKGHAGHIENERADTLARNAIYTLK